MKTRINIPLRVILFECLLLIAFFLIGYLIPVNFNIKLVAIILLFFLMSLFLSRIVLSPVIKIIEKTKESGLEVIQVDREIRKLNNELETANSKNILLNEELKKKNEEMEAFIYSVSHDLRSPLVVVDGYAALLTKKIDPKDPESQRYIERIRENAKLMNSMITSLLELSRIGRISEKKEVVDVDELLERVKKLFALEFESKKIEFIVKGKCPPVFGHTERIFEIFENLISNAIKFKREEEGAYIEVGSNPAEDDFYEYYIKDNGIGISSEFFGKIFLIFYRLKEKDAPGSGVGLAIVKKIIENYGGKINVESEKNKGTTFYFTLPVINKSSK